MSGIFFGLWSFGRSKLLLVFGFGSGLFLALLLTACFLSFEAVDLLAGFAVLRSLRLVLWSTLVEMLFRQSFKLVLRRK